MPFDPRSPAGYRSPVIVKQLVYADGENEPHKPHHRKSLTQTHICDDPVSPAV